MNSKNIIKKIIIKEKTITIDKLIDILSNSSFDLLNIKKEFSNNNDLYELYFYKKYKMSISLEKESGDFVFLENLGFYIEHNEIIEQAVKRELSIVKSFFNKKNILYIEENNGTGVVTVLNNLDHQKLRSVLNDMGYIIRDGDVSQNNYTDEEIKLVYSENSDDVFYVKNISFYSNKNIKIIPEFNMICNFKELSDLIDNLLKN